MRIFSLPPPAETLSEPNFYDTISKIRLRQQLEMYSICKYTLPNYIRVAQSLSPVGFFATPWTVAHQAPLSLGSLQPGILEQVAMPSSRGSPQPSDRNQADSLPSEPPGKPKNTGVGSLSLLQTVFPTLESNQGLPQCRQILYQLSYQESPGKSLIFSLTSTSCFFYCQTVCNLTLLS